MEKKLQKIDLTKVHYDPNQPRKVKPEEEIRELGESIKNKGLLQPPTYRPHPELPGEYMVVFGECRTRAMKLVGMTETDAFITEVTDSKEIFLDQIVENDNRTDLPFMDQVASYDKAINGMGIAIGRLEQCTGKSIQTIQKDMVLINLADDLKSFVNSGILPKEVARKLAEFSSKQKQVNMFKNHLAGKSNVAAMLKTIEALENAEKQTNMFAEARKEAAEKGGMNEVRSRTDRFLKVIHEFDSKHYGDPNVINAKKKNLAELKLGLRTAEKLIGNMKDMLAQFEAAQEINAPKKTGTDNE